MKEEIELVKSAGTRMTKRKFCLRKIPHVTEE